MYYTPLEFSVNLHFAMRVARHVASYLIIFCFTSLKVFRRRRLYDRWGHDSAALSYPYTCSQF